MSVDIECIPRMDCFPIEEAPKDGTRVLAWPIVVDWVRTGRGAHSQEGKEVYGWSVVAWHQDLSPKYTGWICTPNEATEYEPDIHQPKWWMPLPAKPYGEV